ncbi:MAG: hypothetical protein ABR616_05760 [Dermatophilaceae bacterium]|nr:hypothetical protein [Intrasporangiaceae bacterium]
MATTTKGVPYVESPDALADYPDVSLALATLLDGRPGVASLTTTQRDALTGADLWVGRTIYSTTNGRLEFYNGSVWGPVDAPSSDGTSTLTTKGDLLTRTTSGLTRVPVGTNLRPLISNSGAAGGLAWADEAGIDLVGPLKMNGREVQRPSLKDYTEARSVITSSGTVNLNASTASVYRHTPGGSVTYTFNTAEMVSVVQSCTLTLELIFGQSLYAITWPSSVRWPGGTAPAFATSTTNLLTFLYDADNTSWLAGSPLLDIK